jgi:hypothetical protein
VILRGGPTPISAASSDLIGTDVWALNQPAYFELKTVAVCTENLNPHVIAMKSAKNRVRFDASGPLNWARDRRIFVQ